ncbi:hypothetical protein PQZ67_gp28 [Escherichia phage ZCEC13]|nr:hypothetical protein PQZ67_gp28 [Escherichia phage ZCEC13]
MVNHCNEWDKGAAEFMKAFMSYKAP